MATKVIWAHVYDDSDEGRYVGFFMNRKDAQAWIKTQKKRKLRISDKRPVKATKAVDEALDAAIKATRPEEAKK